MDCPSKETIQNFIDCELTDSESCIIREHVRTCDSCKAELDELFALQKAFNRIIDKDVCPSLDILESYAKNTCPIEQAAQISGHIDRCGQCKSYAWAFGASKQELAAWQEQEEQAHREFVAGDLGYNAAKEMLAKLLPQKIELLDKIWQSALDFVLELRDKAIESWPSFTGQAQLVGVLGFDESDPQTDAASVIMMTTLYISQEIADGKLKPTQQDVEAAIKTIAPKFGAGKELQKRLIEYIPTVVLKCR